MPTKIYIDEYLALEQKIINLSESGKVFACIESNNYYDYIVRYQYDNHLGSVCLELDGNGEIISYEEYHPFGTTSYRSGRSEIEVSLKRYKYCGKEKDEETGLYYYGARYYAPWICRFISVDPLQHEQPQLSPYHYCSNNPINRIDPNGMSDESKVEPAPHVAVNDNIQTPKIEMHEKVAIETEPVAYDVLLPELEVIDKISGIILKGTNNSSITIKTDIVNWEFSVDFDFGGDQVIDASRVAIGYETGGSAKAGVLGGAEGNAFVQSVLFLGGDYAGYWYDYVGTEAVGSVSSTADANVGINKNWFVAVNNPKIKGTNNPKDFAGKYSGSGGSGSLEALIVDGSINYQKSVSKNESWTTYSVGASASIGANASIVGLPVGGSVNIHTGITTLINSNNYTPTHQRSWYDKVFNWLKHVF